LKGKKKRRRVGRQKLGSTASKERFLAGPWQRRNKKRGMGTEGVSRNPRPAHAPKANRWEAPFCSGKMRIW